MDDSPKTPQRKGFHPIHIDSLSLADNAVMNIALQNNPVLAKAILAPILGRDDFDVTSVETQRHSELIEGHSVVFDCVICFRDGTLCDLEMQKSSQRMSIERILAYQDHFGCLAIKKGEDYLSRRPTIMVIINNGDLFGDGLPLYRLCPTVKETGKQFFDRQAVYVADINNPNLETELGKLMKDLRCKSPEDIHNPPLREMLRVIKSRKGEEVMNEELLRMYDEAIKEGHEKGLEEGREKGRAEGRFEAYLQLVREGTIPLEVALEKLGVTKEEFQVHLESK